MIRAILGLGNPLPGYAGTRHNFGREAVEAMARTEGLEFKSRFWRNYRLAESRSGILLVLSKTYMNCSGSAAAGLASKYGLRPEEILVLLDDCQLPLGKLRYRKSGSAGGHNGLLSVLEAFGTEEVPRLRMGLGAKVGSLADFVLGKFGEEELKVKEAVCGFLSGIPEGLSRCEEKTINEINNWRAPAYGGASNQEVIP